MRPKIRKVNTNKRKKARKEAAKKLEQQAQAILDHPDTCCVCGTSFERTKETVKTWQVVVREDRVRLTCPSCWATITEVLETEND